MFLASREGGGVCGHGKLLLQRLRRRYFCRRLLGFFREGIFDQARFHEVGDGLLGCA